jgi:hypothetical protein
MTEATGKGRDFYQMFGVEDRRRRVKRARVPVDMLSSLNRTLDRKAERALRDLRISAKAGTWASVVFMEMFGERLLRDIEAWNAVRELFDRVQERRGKGRFFPHALKSPEGPKNGNG